MKESRGFGVIGWVVTIAIIFGIGYVFTRDTDEVMESGAMMMEEDVMTDDSMMRDESVMETDKMMKDEAISSDEMMMSAYSGEVLSGSVSPVLDFTKADYEKAKASDKLVVLYFYATWCPFCQTETKEALYPAFDKLNNENVIAFRVNYNDGDTDEDEKVLAREFGVAYQHTKVFVKNGQRILKSPETWDQGRYETEVANALK